MKKLVREREPLDVPHLVAVNMEEDGHPLQRHHHQHSFVIGADSLIAGSARSSVACKSSVLPDAHCAVLRQTAVFELEANQFLNEALIHPSRASVV